MRKTKKNLSNNKNIKNNTDKELDKLADLDEVDELDNLNNEIVQPKDNNITVSELNKLIKETFKEKLNGKYSVIGEVSNIKLSRDHLYMTLKDDDGMITVTSWNYKKRSNTQIENGNKVIVSGSLTVYPKGGYYQLVTYKIDVVGKGDIFEDFNIAKTFYEEQGYFKDENKIPLPKIINKVGVITAKDGAALQDFLYVLEKNHFLGKVYIKGAVVQGKDCPKSIMDSINLLDSMGLDVIVVTRGGGSFEDLNGFNDPRIIEAIHNAKTCVISAVGHEVDTMLSDYVADLRAPTPSLAGELIIKNQESSFGLSYLENVVIETNNILRNRINQFCSDLYDIKKEVKSPDIIINDTIKLLNHMQENVKLHLKNKAFLLSNEYQKIKNNLQVQDPDVILNRGYCLVLDENDTKITSSLECQFVLENNDKKLKLIFSDGIVLIPNK